MVYVAFLCLGAVSVPCNHCQSGNSRSRLLLPIIVMPLGSLPQSPDSRFNEPTRTSGSFIRLIRLWTAWFDVGRWAFSMAIVVGIIVGLGLSNLEDFRILKIQAKEDSRFKKHEAMEKVKFECHVGTVEFVIAFRDLSYQDP